MRVGVAAYRCVPGQGSDSAAAMEKSTPMVDLPTSTEYVRKVPRMLDNTPREEGSF